MRNKYKVNTAVRLFYGAAAPAPLGRASLSNLGFRDKLTHLPRRFKSRRTLADRRKTPAASPDGGDVLPSIAARACLLCLSFPAPADVSARSVGQDTAG
jgi:hypothetical protein